MRPFTRAHPVADVSAGAAETPAPPGDGADLEARGDLFVERYVDWREECRALDAAYLRWAWSGPAERDVAYAAYRAALDREQRAAGNYELVALCLAATAQP
jgi:hypothetical protein